MLYESPCDVPGYYEREYSEEYQAHLQAKEDWEIEEFESQDLEDQFDQLLEVNWESPR